jgi:hypothetical protein
VKIRLAIAAALAGGLLVSLSGAEAATPVLDGKKVKVLTKTVATGTTQHMADFAGFDPELCDDPTHCVSLPFVYFPAKGVKGGLMFTATWTNPLSDFDLYIIQVDKSGNGVDVGHCGGSAFTSEKVYLSPAELKKGSKYILRINQFRSVQDTVTGKVEINVPSTVPTTLPAAVDELAVVNCTL